MLKSITIVSRNSSCIDCKLTARRVVIHKPWWIKKILFGSPETTEIVVEEWYGQSDNWTNPCRKDRPSIFDKLRFHNLWAQHQHKRNSKLIIGSYKTLFVLKDGDWDLKDSSVL